MICPKCGGSRTYKRGCGRAGCHDCHRTFSVAQAYEPNPPVAKPEGFVASRTTSLVGPDGQVKLQWVRADAERQAQLDVIRETLDAWAERLPRMRAVPATGDYLSSLLAAYPIGDAHIGMRSWGEETGEDFDLAIAERRQCAAMQALVDAAPPAESAVIVNLGDFLHYDSLEAKTPRSGHMLDADGRYAKVLRVAIKVMRQCITSALQRHRSVRVINAVGNHDETGALWLSAALAHIYEREPRVSVDESPSLFTYLEHGACLVGVHHGHTTKPDTLPSVMAADRAEAWGRTRHRYWWTGHVHHQVVREFPGVTVESFNTLAPNDAYAAAGGWRSRENMKCLVLHREHGEVARYTVNPRMLHGKAQGGSDQEAASA